MKQLSHSPGDLKTIIAEENAVIREAHFAGASGSEVVQRRTALIDRILRDAHAQFEASGPMPALLAIGGYGRGELNPHSDIDIMFLCRNEADRTKSADLLYLLWDAGLDIGYSVRTIEECVALARQDIKIRTSLLESRLISGDNLLYQSFLRSMNSDVFYWKPSAFINEKLSERSSIRHKFGGSIYLREPNIKEGMGGLRDIHTALWIAFVHFRISSLAELVDKGVVTAGQYTVFSRSRNFLWNIRNELHYLSGRKNDHLTFDLQERCALDFRYRDSSQLLAVERFMKSYFIHARNIREFTNIVTESVLPKQPRRWFEWPLSLGPFSLVGKTLFLKPGTDCNGDISLIMKAFQTAHTRRARFSDRLGSTIRSCRINPEDLGSPSAALDFLTILNKLDGLAETLTLMKDLRFLGRYIPEFRKIQALARHDYYHMYAVDEHILLAIRNLSKLETGSAVSVPSLREALAGLRKPWVLTLALLLHDLGKAYRTGHDRHGAAIARGVLQRLGLNAEDERRVLFLVENHLVMSTLSQRRELSDRKVITDFCRLVEDRENAAMLYLLTYADISAVNPTAWTQWKAVLLQDLYLKTLDHLDSTAHVAEELQARIEKASARIKDAAEGKFQPVQVEVFLASMPDQYILSTSPGRVIDHMNMSRRLPSEQLVIQYRHVPDKGYTELTVCAYDAYGMFFRTAGTIASKNLNILKAKVYTSKNGVMIDTFQITDSHGSLCSYNDVWESLLHELRASLMSGFRPPEPGLYAPAHPARGTITPVIEFDNSSSDIFTIIDMTACDSIGFLYKVTKTLFELNLNLASAKIVTEGARIMDSFYVTDLLRKKITEAERLDKIRDALLKVVE